MKTTFELGMGQGDKGAGHKAELKLIGKQFMDKPYVAIYITGITSATKATFWIEDEDLERLARNILRTMGKETKPKRKHG